MRKIILLISLLFISTLLFSQEKVEVIYLNDGRVIKGYIIKQDIDIIVRSVDGFLYSFKRDEIQQILTSEQEKKFMDYGGSTSYGIGLGGGGLVTTSFRFHKSSSFAFELSGSYDLGTYKFEKGSETISVTKSSIVFSVGPNFYASKKLNAVKQRYVLNGLTLKAGCGIGGVSQLYVAYGWIHERFKIMNNTKSFNFELAPAFIVTNLFYENHEYSKTGPGLYMKFQWNWYSA